MENNLDQLNGLEEKPLEKIESTMNFQQIIKNAEELYKAGNEEQGKKLLCQTEEWMNKNRDRVNDGGRWIDHREGDLFKIFWNIGDVDGANRIIESMTNTEHANNAKSREGRINVLSREMEKTN